MNFLVSKSMQYCAPPESVILRILICGYSNETSSALFIGDWLLEKWKLKFILASESWFPVDEKKSVETIGLNKLKGFWKSSSSSSSSSSSLLLLLLLINYLSMNSHQYLLSSTIYHFLISIPLYPNGRFLCDV